VPGRLVALGGAVEIIEPAEVRERAISLAHELIGRHALSRTARSAQRRATPATSR
jgi:hypothetical protein